MDLSTFMDAKNDPNRAASYGEDESSLEAEQMAHAQARVGTVLRDKYRIDRVLGVGGMAVVYVATHRNRQSFAIKMLHPVLSINPAIRARFLGEGYRANSVKHKSAVTVFDDDVAEDGSVFLVMELLEGDSLDRVCQRHGQRLPLRAVLAIGYQLLDVLEAAHAANVVHRDIKPANLFLTREGTIKVLDFGIARLLESAGGQMTRTGAVLGTPAFMAPEQARGRLDEIDGQTDIWAVGATLFSLLTGGLVHESESSQMLLVDASTQPAPSLATRIPEALPGVVALVDRALAFEKADRWPNAGTMREAIRDVYVVEFGEELSAAPLAALLLGPAPSGAAVSPATITRSVGEHRDVLRGPVAGASRPNISTIPEVSRKAAASSTPPSAGRRGWIIAGGACVIVAVAAPAVYELRVSRTPQESAAAHAIVPEHAALPAPAPAAPMAPAAMPSVPAHAATDPRATPPRSPATVGKPRPRHQPRANAKDPSAAQPATHSNPLDMPLLP